MRALWLICCLLPPAIAFGQPEAPDAAAELPVDPLDRVTPRRSFEGFMRAAEQGDFERAARYLDLRNLPPRFEEFSPAEIADNLAIVVERNIWIDPSALSDSPEGDLSDGLPSYRDVLGRITAGDKDYVLLMQRVPRGDGQYIWKISNATVARLEELYEVFGYGPVAEALAEALPNWRFLGIELFKWVLTLGSMLLAYLLAALLGLLLARLFSGPGKPLYRRLRHLLVGPVAAVIAVIIGGIVIIDLGIGLTGRKILEAGTLLIAATTWLLLALINLLRDAYALRLERRGKGGAMVLLRPASNAIKLFVLLSAVLLWLENIGYDITTLLAGLGVGGVAVALALQRPMEDVFGALALYTQQPVRIGDFCRIGGTVGTIEEIGLRSTRIRTPANTLIAVPNARLAEEPIDNYSARRKILYNPTLRLRCDTPLPQLEQVLAGLRALLAGHGRVLAEGARVRFQKIAADALEVTVFAYVDTTDYADYLAVAEELNKESLRVIEAAGTQLALPGRLLFHGDASRG